MDSSHVISYETLCLKTTLNNPTLSFKVPALNYAPPHHCRLQMIIIIPLMSTQCGCGVATGEGYVSKLTSFETSKEQSIAYGVRPSLLFRTATIIWQWTSADITQRNEKRSDGFHPFDASNHSKQLKLLSLSLLLWISTTIVPEPLWADSSTQSFWPLWTEGT